MFKDTYSYDINLIDTHINKFIDSIDNVEPVIKEAFRYTVLNGGKRIRSVLCIEIAKMLGGNVEEALDFAMAVEFIHAYSLVHDDLPCLDNDDMRRGLPSCHRKFGEGIAIFTGDALLHTAFEIMCASSVKNGFGHTKAMEYVARCSGIYGMIGGQFTDVTLTSSGTEITYDKLLSLIDRKTTALIRAGAVSGAYISSENEDIINKIEKYAFHMGVAFQIRDDFEDEIQDENSECNPNFINILGREEALKHLRMHREKSEDAIKDIANNEFLLNLNSYLFDNITKGVF